MIELFTSMPAGLVLRPYMQYSVAVCSQPEAAGDVISDVAVEYVSMDVHAKFVDSRF